MKILKSKDVYIDLSNFLKQSLEEAFKKGQEDKQGILTSFAFDAGVKDERARRLNQKTNE